MTRPSAVSRNDYVGTGTTGPFAYTFPVLAVSDLRVIKRSATTGTETVLAYPADWTTTDIFPVTAGSITLTTALATGDVLTVRRGPALTQLTSFRSQGSFSPAIHEDAFDHATDEIQSNADAIARTPKLKESYNPALYSLDFAPGSTGQVLGWNGTALGPLGPPVSTGVTLPAQGRSVASLTAYLGNNSVFNVLDFPGIDPTGVADSSAAIQAAIDAAAAATIGMCQVWIPKGTYKLANGITVPGGVAIIGAGGPSDSDGGFGTVARTNLNYTKTSGIAITLLGTAAQGQKNSQLIGFMLSGTANADGGILVGSGAGGSNQVNHSALRDLTVVGFTKVGAYGFSFRRMLTSVMEKCIAIGCYDGFKFPNDAAVTTLAFINCHGYSCDRNGFRFDNPPLAASCSFYSCTAESNDAAGVYIDGGSYLNWYGLYCEANNLVSGAAPVMVLGSLGNPSTAVRFYSPHIVDPVGNQRAFDFDRASQCLIFFPVLEFATTNWCAVTANTANCVAYLADDLAPSLVTGNNAGRMAIHRPASRSTRSGATAAVTDGATITHGLGITPVVVRATASVAGEFVSVTALGVTTFTVAIKKHDGTAGTSQTVYWQAEL